MQREGTDVTLVGYGKMVGYNLEAAEQLEKEGISCEVGSFTVHLLQQQHGAQHHLQFVAHMSSHWRSKQWSFTG